MDDIQKLKETILKEYPRLGENDSFHFECGPHLECFNKCCADVNIFLTPYDVLRMKNTLNMTSAEFLGKHTLVPFDKNQNLPVPLLLMKETAEKECPFVDAEKGCTIYSDRPWPCRMYPIGLASPGEAADAESVPFYFIMREDVCRGLEKSREWTISGWLEDQGILRYNEFGDLFKDVTLHKAFAGGWKPNPKHIEMYWMALYDLDRFREFILNSTFLDRFNIEKTSLDKLRDDDEELLRFGFKWVKMALFGERTIPIRTEAEEKFRSSSEANRTNC